MYWRDIDTAFSKGLPLGAATGGVRISVLGSSVFQAVNAWEIRCAWGLQGYHGIRWYIKGFRACSPRIGWYTKGFGVVAQVPSTQGRIVIYFCW